MPSAYSIDLRQRIVDAVEQAEYTIDEIAEMFCVHRSYVFKLLKQQREKGTLEPLPHGGGQKPKLKDEHLEIIKELVKEFPDAFLEKLCEKLKERTKIEVSTPTMSRSLKKIGVSIKKSPDAPRKPIQLNEKNSKSFRRR